MYVGLKAALREPLGLHRVWLCIGLVAILVVVGCGGLDAPGLPCNGVQDCASEMVCVSGVCQENSGKSSSPPATSTKVPCNQTSDCSGSETCLAGACSKPKVENPSEASACLPSRFQKGGLHSAVEKVVDLSLSYSGNSMVTAHYELLKVWDNPSKEASKSSQLRNVLFSRGEAFTNARLSPDGKYVASASPKNIKLWNVATGKLKYHWQIGTSVLAMTFSKDGKSLVVVSVKQVNRWSVETGRVTHVLSLPERKTHSSLHKATLNTSGTLAVVLWALRVDSTNKERWRIQVLDTQTGALTTSFQFSDTSSSVRSLTLSEDGTQLRMIVKRSWSFFMLRWELKNQSLLETKKLPLPSQNSPVALHPTQPLAAISDMNDHNDAVPYRYFFYWDIERGRKVQQARVFHVKKTFMTHLVYSGDGSRVGVVFNSGAIAALTTEEQRQVFTYATPFSDNVSIRGLHFSHNGTQLQTLSSDGMLQSWNVESRRRAHVLHHNREIRLIRVDASRQRAIVLRADKKLLELWNLETGATRKFVEVEDTITMLAISPKGDYVSAIFAERDGSKERVIKVWSVPDSRLVASLTVKNPNVYRWFLGGLSFSPNGSTLAVLPYLRHPVVLWNFIEKTQQTIPFPLLYGNSIAQLKYSADGKLLGLVAGKNSYMLDPTTRKVRYQMELHKGNVTDLTFSPEGRWFATTSSGDGIVRVWDTQTGKLHGTLMSDHSESLARVVFHPNGKSLAYISSRGQLAYWQCPQ